MNENQTRDVRTAIVACAMKIIEDHEDSDGADELHLVKDAYDLAKLALAFCEEDKEHVVQLTPFERPKAALGNAALASTDVGPFTSRAEAERTLRGAMTTGRFASGTIVTRERGAS